MSEAIKQPSAEPMILLQGVNKWYGQFHVLKDINLSVQQGERIVLCGPSGSGKSTTIRCINRLEEHQQGRIVVDGTDLLAHNAATAEFDLNARLANNMGCSVLAVIGGHGTSPCACVSTSCQSGGKLSH